MNPKTDYHGMELRGRDFRGMNLARADFREADLRGADFTGASLIDANFTNARLGVRPFTGFLLLLGAVSISIAAGVATGLLAEATRQRAISSDWQDVLGGWLLVLVVVVFLFWLVRKGALQAVRIFAIVMVSALVLDFVILLIFGSVRLERGLPIVGLILLFVPAAIAGILGRVVGGTMGTWAIAAVAALGGLAAGRVSGGFAAVVVSLLLVVVSRRALKGDARDLPVRRLAHRIVTHRGTRFTEADVTRADFTGTILTQTDMTRAVLADAVWEQGRGPFIIDEPIVSSEPTSDKMAADANGQQAETPNIADQGPNSVLGEGEE